MVREQLSSCFGKSIGQFIENYIQNGIIKHIYFLEDIKCLNFSLFFGGGESTIEHVRRFLV